ncbi:hypothetical protein ACE1ET_13235 [Saccharicrinis sp. FJH62]|uniref:hypothetical protein n=1 Tax=Saccharicrinis sp. FJH62 TaxID=3344657 RepID=UPI0035D4378E
MDSNKYVKDTWIIVIAITAFAYLITGFIELNNGAHSFHTIAKLTTGIILIINGFIIKLRTKSIFKNPAPYFIMFFLGYVLSLVGIMITFNAALWIPGVLLLLGTLILAYIKPFT